MARGCYGIIWHGIDGAARYFCEVPDDSPKLTVRRRHVEHDMPRDVLFTDTHAYVPLSDGTGAAEVDRRNRTVTLSVRHDYDDEAVLHPLLAASAAAINYWLRRDSFHAGAVVLGGRAWIVVGEKGDGKSTTLAYLATRGLPVLADDLIIEHEGEALAGPGFIDLRPDAATALGVGRDIGWLGARMRSRFDLPARPSRVAVGGWIGLGWGETFELTPLPLDERLDLLYESRTIWDTPADPASYLRHAARPAFELSRPKDWSQLPQLYDLLVSALA